MIQHKGYMTNAKEEAIAKFEQYVCEKVESLKISALAEEFSLDSVKINGVSASTLSEIAAQKQLQHIFCDPGITERKRLGISSGIEGSAEREEYWLEQLDCLRTESLIFICGDSHVDSFQERLRSSGISAQVLSRGWGKELNSSRK
jgi:hypothetical protein